MLGLELAVRVRVIQRIGLGVRHGLTLTFPVGMWRVSAREVKYRLQQGRVRVKVRAVGEGLGLGPGFGLGMGFGLVLG